MLKVNLTNTQNTDTKSIYHNDRCFFYVTKGENETNEPQNTKAESGT